MALTEKGRNALNFAQKFFPTGTFSAKDLSDACGEKIVATTLNGVVNNGYMSKIPGSPVQFSLIDGIEEILAAALEEEKNKGCTNDNLHKALKNKNDEFYTRYEDIELEVTRYKDQFKNKIIYLPCDDPAEKKSEFWSFFVNNFNAFGLKKLIATHYDENGKAYKIWINGDIAGDGSIDDADALQEDLEGNGDFRSPECLNILNECDIVITNPPFSLFREFVIQILKANKQFLIIGNQNTFASTEIFPLIKEEKIWTGYNTVHKFIQPDKSIKEFGNICWFTNLNNDKKTEELLLTKDYNKIDYPKYDNYDAIEVDKLVNIPKNYQGIMGVPISYLGKYNSNQFKILGLAAGNSKVHKLYYDVPHYNNDLERGGCCVLNGIRKYSRVFIQKV